MRRAIGNLQLSMVSIGLCVGYRKPATVNGFYRPMRRAIESVSVATYLVKMSARLLIVLILTIQILELEQADEGLGPGGRV